MPISIRRDVEQVYNLGNNFRLSYIPNLTPSSGGSTSFLDTVRTRVSAQKWLDFSNAALSAIAQDPGHAERNIARVQAEQFNYQFVPNSRDCLKYLWKMVKVGKGIKGRQKYKKMVKEDLQEAYRKIAVLAAVPGSEFPGVPTFDRVVDRTEPRFVIFSDHHFTQFPNLPNYFLEHNYPLYLDILRYYAHQTDYVLVENGDLEDYIIFEPTPGEAEDWWKDAKWDAANAAVADGSPIDPNDPKWATFLDRRYRKREEVLDSIISSPDFAEYYDLVRTAFNGRLVRLSGNHDTYQNNDLEQGLLNMITPKIGADIHDVLRVQDPRSGATTHVVLHGHQVDSVCLQHGEVPLAMTFGEIFSECLSWAYQGPDRFWAAFDARKWHVKEHPDPFENKLAWADNPSVSLWDPATVVAMAASTIRTNGKTIFEQLLGHEVAWEYFENTHPLDAFALEVMSGEETWKFRHMNEVAFCEGYVKNMGEMGLDDPEAMPKVIMGHTHEVRHLPTDPNGRSFPNGVVYLNSGSAGRFEGLIWCVELDEGKERICSWSRDRDQLRHIVWSSDGSGSLVPETSTLI